MEKHRNHKKAGRFGRRLARFISTTLVVVGILGVMAGSADASVSRNAGGYASTSVVCNRGTQRLSIHATVYQDNGGSQTVAARLWVFHKSFGAWKDYGWLSGNTQEYWSGTGSSRNFKWDFAWNDGFIDQHYVFMEYAWYTTSGWQFGSESIKTYNQWNGIYGGAASSTCFA